MKGIAKRLAISMLAVYLCLGAQAQERVFGDWGVELMTDPMTDQNEGFMAAFSWDNPWLGGQYAEGVLAILCRDSVVVDIAFGLDLERSLLRKDFSYTATFRIDKGPVQTSEGSSSPNGAGYLFARAEVPKLLQDLVGASNFVFRIDTEDEGTLTYQTRVEGFAEAYEFCRSL
ncbi:MAG: hypothetical protein OXM87_11975 [Truepera sp.]|nr:hypothetical protein [Truepera sp.]